MYCLKINVIGKVQGVFYRATAKEKAREFGINGWVKNEPDGSVSILAEGEEVLVIKMLEWSKEGPSYCRVDKVEFEEMKPKNHSHFKIKF